MRKLEIFGGVSDSKRPLIIAEACENHLGNLSVAKDMINRAKDSGCDVIKFQHHKPEYEMKRGLKMSDNFDEDLYDFLLRCSLKIEDHIELYDYCNKVGIYYLCTPFCKEAAQELVENRLGDVFKIGSGEMNDFPLLKYLANNGMTMLISTGMSTLNEIDDTVDFLNSIDAQYSLFHCVSEYPPSYDDIALNTISLLRDKYPTTCIGFSCHTPEIYTAIAAVSLNTNFIEKHVIIDKNQRCPDQSVSISFQEMKQLVDAVKKIHSSLGFRNKIYESECQIRQWARHSIVARERIPIGTLITEKNVTTMRAGNGISSQYFFSILGRKATQTIEAGTPLSEEHF